MRGLRSICAVILVIAMTAALCGCSKDPEDEKKLPSSEGFTNDVLMRIGGSEVSYAEGNIYLLSMREEVEALYGSEIWDLKFTREERPYSELMKERLLEKLIYIKLVCHMADEFDVKLEADDILNVNEYTQQYLSGLTESTAKKYGITEELVRSIYNDNVLAEKTYQTITLNADKTAVLYSTDGSYEDTMNCTYTAENGKLTLNPPAEYADDDPEVMNYRIENGKLYLSQGEGQYSMTMIFEKNK